MREFSTSYYGTQYEVEYLWHHMDWFLRIDSVVLAIMFACTLVLVGRVSRCYRLSLQKGIDTPAGKRVAAELRRHVAYLKLVAITAPYLGLLGTCWGILSTFGGFAMEKHAYLAWMTSKVAAALIPCAAGTVVAVAGTFGHTYGGTRLESLRVCLPSRYHLPRKHFAEFASFGLVAAWLLAILIRVFFIPFTPLHSSTGFDVGIASVPCHTPEGFIVLRLSNRGEIFLNSEEQHDWANLQRSLSEIYGVRTHRVLYVTAEKGVPFQTVADAIDVVRSTPEDITIQLVTPQDGCDESMLMGGSTRLPSK